MKTKVLFMAFAFIAMVGTLSAQTTKAAEPAKSVIKNHVMWTKTTIKFVIIMKTKHVLTETEGV